MMMTAPALAVPRKRPYLIASLALHALLAGYLYYFGTVEFELRRQDEQVASSMRATSQARTARRVDDLKNIKELLEKSAQREDEAQQQASPAAPTPLDSDPKDMLAEARELSKAIEDIHRDIQAEELARLTGKPKEEALAEVEAAALPTEPPSADLPKQDGAISSPAEEIAKLEEAAREVLAKRGEALQRMEQGVPVSGSGAPTGAPGEEGEGTASEDTARDHTGSGNGSPAPVAQEIAAFMRDGVEAEKAAPSRRYKGGEERFFHGGVGHIPHVDPSRMIKAKGRMLGAGGQYTNRIYLNSWYLIGPFAGRHGAGLFNNPKYPPEDAVLLDAVYRGKDNRLVKWEYVNDPSYPLIPRDHAEDAVYYGYTEIWMDQERDLMVWIGADDDARVHLNGKVMWKGGNWNKQWFWDTLYGSSNTYVRDYNRTEGKKIVRFQKGRNTIFFKLSNGPTRLFFSMVLTLPEQR